jgi:hypothetical protein
MTPTNVKKTYYGPRSAYIKEETGHQWNVLPFSVRCRPIKDFVAIDGSQIDHMISLAKKTKPCLSI